jgi:predicted O-methyltransferase YrrM
MALRRLPAASVNVQSLVNVNHLNLRQMFSESEERALEWQAVEQQIAPLEISEPAGGVNPGDRRALYTLVRALRPRRVLEVGTHVGASTAAIALALRRLGATELSAAYRLSTVDICDVNDPETRPWLRFGSASSPADVVRRLGCADLVTFVAESSIDFLARQQQTFDLIFLDGDHSAHNVYREIPAAMQRLNRGGVIVLHDYYPQLRPLWSNGMVSPGPYLAIRRLRREGTPLRAVPLGRLPWPTKLGSHMTSLALLGRA